MTVIMWEARAADGRLDDLIAYAKDHAAPAAQVYRAAAGPPRVVVIDPSGLGISDVPSELLARPAYQWAFEPV